MRIEYVLSNSDIKGNPQNGLGELWCLLYTQHVRTIFLLFYREKEPQPLRKCNRCDYYTRNRDRLRSHKITNCDFKRKEIRGISERKMGRPKKIR